MTETHDRADQSREQEQLLFRLKRWFRSDAFKCVLMAVAASVIILAMFLIVCVPKRYDLTVNSIAPETIKATKDVVDEVTTQERSPCTVRAGRHSRRFPYGAQANLSTRTWCFRGTTRSAQ